MGQLCPISEHPGQARAGLAVLAPAAMHQAMGSEIEDRKSDDNEQNPPGLRFDEMDQAFRIGEQPGGDLVGTMPDIGQ